MDKLKPWQAVMIEAKIWQLGTRGSKLARWQTDHVLDLLCETQPDLIIFTKIFRTQGDKILDKPLPLIGGKGLFTLELERALYAGDIDAAVHSLKDLPTDSPAGLTVGATPARAHPGDVLISREGHTLDSLPRGAVVGTSSRRRAAQLLRCRPDLQVRDIRGNIDTRLGKGLEPCSPYDAIVLARAGLERLGLLHKEWQTLPFEVMLPAPGQGALGVQCRDDAASHEVLDPLDHPITRAAVTAERTFLARLGGGCSTPIAALAEVEGERLCLRGRILTPDGTQQIEVEEAGTVGDADAVGSAAAQRALGEGAREYLNM